MLRNLLMSCLLLLAASALPSASADDLGTCVGYKEGMCEENAVLVVDAGGAHVDACVIGVSGSCDPYQGDLVRAHAADHEFSVPDPCYTTMCF